MVEPTLRDRRILVVEDEYMLADELDVELHDEGAEVLGPVGTVEQALGILRADGNVDGAILDVNLGGEDAYPVADVLIERGVPFVFTTGYDRSIIPPRFSHVARCEKPISIAQVKRAIGRAIGG